MITNTALYLVCLFITCATANFTFPDCWEKGCVVKSGGDTWCFIPIGHLDGYQLACTNNWVLRVLMTHLNSTHGSSIAYYDDQTQFLGPATWVMPTPVQFPIFVCMTGQRGAAFTNATQRFRTVCRAALHDNDMGNTTAHAEECVVDLGQLARGDACSPDHGLASPTASKTRAMVPSASGLDNPVLQHVVFVLEAGLALATLYAFGRLVVRRLRDYLCGKRTSATSGDAMDLRLREGRVPSPRPFPEVSVTADTGCQTNEASASDEEYFSAEEAGL
ncbi:hypothetical protein EXIGLDRAFT_760564 [Exidia glandulosa HHB12029]|uniref:Extracellular membrane protein CFEM domain-containing protein n=1 Tax=Exidia glandulosa HHB12029 TaxID=1314781 RepID=A0A166BJF6_EXIGL|nr:hypothetical protein EXIGLDRAFT_760564 [Exidia glandulosa HHB12029]